MPFSLPARRIAAALTMAAALLVLPASAALAQETPEAPPEPPQQRQADLLSTLEAEGNFTVLLDALAATGLRDQFEGKEVFTFFAPTDEAFSALPEGAVDSMDADQLRAILAYHVVSGRATAGDLASAEQTQALSGASLTFEQAGGGLTVNGEPVTEADIKASNGIIHAIGGVLMPPEAETTPAPAQAPDHDEDMHR